VKEVKLRLTKILRIFAFEKTMHIFDSYCYNDSLGFLQYSRYKSNPDSWWDGSRIYGSFKEDLGPGEDPRCFFLNGYPCVYAIVFNTTHGWLNKIYLGITNRWYTLWLPRNLSQGKNWTPFVRNNEIYFIHEFAPFRLLKIELENLEDSFLKATVVYELDNTGETSGTDGYSIYRGGSNGLESGNIIYGFGHTNRRNDQGHVEHRPFLWQFDFRSTPTISEFKPNDFEKSLAIVDPTSLLSVRGTHFLVTCESQLHWQYGAGGGRICLYKIDTESLREH
jgi:hypothetical protein